MKTHKFITNKISSAAQRQYYCMHLTLCHEYCNYRFILISINAPQARQYEIPHTCRQISRFKACKRKQYNVSMLNEKRVRMCKKF